MRLRAALCLLLTHCAPDSISATAVVVSVKTDLTLGSELRQVNYRVFSPDDDPDFARPVAEYTSAAQDLDHPFVILHQHREDLLLSVEGYKDAGKAPIVIARVRARFVPQESLALRVFLARACLYELCATNGLTCYGTTRGEVDAGECAIIPGPDVLTSIRTAGQELDW